MGYLKELLYMISPLISIFRVKGGVSFNEISVKEKSKKCIMLGNGPSLNDDIQKIYSEIDEVDIACVNTFPNTEHFNNLKPKYLFLMDTAWWRADPKEEFREQREKLFNNLNTISWDIQVIVSCNADMSFLEKKLKNNYIEIVKFKSASSYHILNEKAFKYYDTGYFTPPLKNVMVFSNFFLVKAGYEVIDIYGADLSYVWLIDVDQDTNQIITKTEHFHEDSVKKPLALDAGENPEYATMYKFLNIQALTYKSHELINDYAKLKGVKIINKSAYSTIDAYDRN